MEDLQKLSAVKTCGEGRIRTVGTFRIRQVL